MTISNHAFQWRFVLVLPVLAAILSTACSQSDTHKPSPSGPEQTKENPEITGPHFRFSQQQAISGGPDEKNWCRGRFDQAVVINAEKDDPNRRYFYLSPGTTKLAIGPSGMTALFMLRPAGNGIVEIFHGAHFPSCLSQPANFSPAGPATVVQYHNHKNMTFALETREEGGHSIVTLVLPEGNRYGLDIDHCSNCE